MTRRTSPSDRKERLAINLFDLSKLDPTMRGMTTQGKLDVTNAIWVDKSRVDESAVAFTCDLTEAACIIDILRKGMKKYGANLRAYLSRNGTAWSKIPNEAILVLIENGQPVLSPVWFKREVQSLPVEPIPVEIVEWE